MVLLVDGDVMAHLACKPYFENKSLIPDGSDKVDHMTMNPEQFMSYLEQSYRHFKTALIALKDQFFVDDSQMRVAVKGEGNFRSDLYPEYKMNRHADPKKMNPFVPIIRERAAAEGLCIPSHGMEADDWLRIWAEDCRERNTPFVIVSIDKDLKCIPGRHYNPRKKVFEDITPEYATRFYYEQLLKGDPTDNIKGVPGVGEKTATKMLEYLTEEYEFQYMVTTVYMEHFGESWRKELELTGNLIYLLKAPDDRFSLDDWIINDELAAEIEAAGDDTTSVEPEGSNIEPTNTEPVADTKPAAAEIKPAGTPSVSGLKAPRP